ncbi:MAG: hypothetical protein MRERV_37c012 [Mycoplasmataceae bacterium RV_VA103A]|nr:MAG: hypothetical protein MRERV_37c012 [Mycoplasmataceae bacterium RV_VA103A]
MSTKKWYWIVFLLGFFLIACWKIWAWVIWKILNLRKDKQVFNLLAKNRFLEITGPSRKGKSWLLCHLFLNLKGVKFTNLPTPRGTYTLKKEDYITHMTRNWQAPARYYYFLDDLPKFQKWGKKNLGRVNYHSWKEYLTDCGKLGGTCVWTNNGLEAEPIYQVSKNEKWTVKGYISFFDYSLLLVLKGWWFTLIPIDNKEIESFYDPHWNIPKDWQKNWLTQISNKLKGQELKNILDIIGEKKIRQTYQLETENRRLIQTYLKERRKEEKEVKKVAKKEKQDKKDLVKYGIKKEPLTWEDIAKGTKENYEPKKRSQASKK